MKTRLIVLSIVAQLCLSAIDARAHDTDVALYFSAGWRTGPEAAENIVQLAVVFRCGNSWCIERETFAGRRNLGFTSLPVRHEMRAPFRASTCSDGPVNTIEGTVDTESQVRLARTSDGWELETRDSRYVWRDVGASGQNGHRLTLVTLTNLKSNRTIDQVVGFGFTARQAVTITSLAPIKYAYDGDISHKDMNAKVGDAWDSKRSIIDFRPYQSTKANAGVWTLTQPGHRDVVARLGKDLWVENAIAIATPRSRHLSYVVHEYGHDFNGNGCFDEPGHNKLMLPVLDGERVVAMPYVEYTPDRRDGVPMLSVGYYYLRPPRLK